MPDVLDAARRKFFLVASFTFVSGWFNRCYTASQGVSERMNDQVALWEEVADRKEREWKSVWGSSSNPEMASLHYHRDVVPYRQLVRLARTKAGHSVCFAALDCLSMNVTTKCAAGKHDSCSEHANTCVLCAGGHS